MSEQVFDQGEEIAGLEQLKRELSLARYDFTQAAREIVHWERRQCDATDRRIILEKNIAQLKALHGEVEGA